LVETAIDNSLIKTFSSAREGTIDDIEVIVNIISSTFSNNHGVCWLLKHKGKNKKEIESLARYAYYKSLHSKGVYISANNKGVALCYKSNDSRFSFIEFYYQLKFVFTSINLLRLPSILKRENRRKKIRQNPNGYLYFWFLGVLPEGKGAGFELKNAVLSRARDENLVVYLETSNERNKNIYERLGFSTYHYWEDKKADIIFWFLKWEPNDLKKNTNG